MFALIGMQAMAQVGIGKNTPTSTLDVNGSISVGFREVSNNVSIGIDDHYVTYVNTSSTQPSPAHVVTLPTGDVQGRIYYIKNSSAFNINVTAQSSQTMRVGNAAGVTTYTIPAGQTFRVIRTANATTNAWELTRAFNPNVQNSDITLYATQLKVPNYNVTSAQYGNFTYNNWRLVSVNKVGGRGDRIRGTSPLTSGGRATIGFRGAILELTYEYQGTPFIVNNIHPVITTGNFTENKVALVPSYSQIYNENGKTRLNIAVGRIDLYGINAGANDSNISYISEWTQTNAFLDVLLTRQMNN